MRDMARIKEARERNEKALRLRPSIGRGTSVTTIRMTEGLVCEISEGAWTAKSDAPEEEGGENTAPSPGFFVRGGLGACCAMGIMERAARYGVPIDHVEVEVQADYDSNGEFGLADVPVGFSAVRWIVQVESSAPEAEIMKVIEEEERYGFMLDVIRSPIPVTREVRITTPAGA
jgi:uncharacterized OsmC-like protein